MTKLEKRCAGNAVQLADLVMVVPWRCAIAPNVSLSWYDSKRASKLSMIWKRVCCLVLRFNLSQFVFIYLNSWSSLAYFSNWCFPFCAADILVPIRSLLRRLSPLSLQRLAMVVPYIRSISLKGIPFFTVISHLDILRSIFIWLHIHSCYVLAVWHCGIRNIFDKECRCRNWWCLRDWWLFPKKRFKVEMGPVERPVLPPNPMACPALTISFWSAMNFERWA